MDDARGPVAVLTIETVAETGSTNADLLAAAARGAPEGYWLRAERQVRGRGRLGRIWGDSGGNVAASTIVRLRPGDPPAPSLALVAAVVVAEAVATFAPGLATIKWPNDLLIGNAKLSGVLLERGADDAVIVGIGVNLASHPGLAERPTTSLADHHVTVAPAPFVEVLADSMARWLATWRIYGLDPVRARWLAGAHPVGTALSVQLPDGRAVDGLFDGLDGSGALLMRMAGGGREVVHAGDVFLL